MKNTIGVIWVISGNRKIIPDHLATDARNDMQILFNDFDLKVEIFTQLQLDFVFQSKMI